MPLRGKTMRDLEDSTDDPTNLPFHLQRKLEKRRKSLHRLGGLYGLNPSSDRHKFPFPFKKRGQRQHENLKSRYDAPNKHIQNQSQKRNTCNSKNINPRWNFGTHPHSVCGHGTAWDATLNYLTTEEIQYLVENRNFEHSLANSDSMHVRRRDPPPLDPSSHFLLPKTATKGQRCQYCFETGRVAPLEKNLVDAKPHRMVAGQRMKESRSDTNFLFHATLVCNRQLSPRSLRERLDAPVKERSRRLAQRDPCCERLRVHPIFKSVSLEHVRKVMQRSASDDQATNDGEEDTVTPDRVNRFQFMRAMSYLGFAHSDGKLLSRLYSSFDCDSEDQVSINSFVQHFQELAQKQQTVNFS